MHKKTIDFSRKWQKGVLFFGKVNVNALHMVYNHHVLLSNVQELANYINFVLVVIQHCDHDESENEHNV